MNNTSEWIQVGELAQTLGGHALPPSVALVGRAVELHFEDGTRIRYDFPQPDRLAWRILHDGGIAAADVGPEREEQCRVTEIRPGIYLVDFHSARHPRRAITLLLDLFGQVGTVVQAELPTAEEIALPIFRRAADHLELTAVKARFLPVRIGQPIRSAVDWHLPTDALIGRRIAFRYSDMDVYEHIYLSPERFTWHCLSGVEAGLADTEATEHRLIADDLVLFCWREKIVPTFGLLLIDLHRGGSAGKVLGYTDGTWSEVTNAPVGSSIIRIG